MGDFRPENHVEQMAKKAAGKLACIQCISYLLSTCSCTADVPPVTTVQTGHLCFVSRTKFTDIVCTPPQARLPQKPPPFKH